MRGVALRRPQFPDACAWGTAGPLTRVPLTPARRPVQPQLPTSLTSGWGPP